MSATWFQRANRFGTAVLDELFRAPQQQMLDEAQERGWRIDRPGEYCPRCGATAGAHAALPGGCAFCIDKPLAWANCTRLSAYRQPVDGWVRAMKFAGQWSWAKACGTMLAQAIAVPSHAHASVAVTPVPMHWLRRWRRGYNQAHLIAAAVARTRQWPLAQILHRTRYTLPQTSVAPSMRPANITNSFRIDGVDLAGWHIVLVDDVKTSGATLGACARLLKRAGAASVHAAVIAVADPRGKDFKRL